MVKKLNKMKKSYEATLQVQILWFVKKYGSLFIWLKGKYLFIYLYFQFAFYLFIYLFIYIFNKDVDLLI